MVIWCGDTNGQIGRGDESENTKPDNKTNNIIGPYTRGDDGER